MGDLAENIVRRWNRVLFQIVQIMACVVVVNVFAILDLWEMDAKQWNSVPVRKEVVRCRVRDMVSVSRENVIVTKRTTGKLVKRSEKMPKCVTKIAVVMGFVNKADVFVPKDMLVLDVKLKWVLQIQWSN